MISLGLLGPAVGTAVISLGLLDPADETALISLGLLDPADGPLCCPETSTVNCKFTLQKSQRNKNFAKLIF